MDLKKAIVEINGLFNNSLIDRIINYIDKENLSNLGVEDSKLNSVRNVKGFSCGHPTLIKNIPNQDMTRFLFFKYVQKELFTFLINYKTKLPFFKFDHIVQSDFLKYEVNGKYEVHCDASSTMMRHLSIIVNLNEDYEGGDFVFFNPFNKEEIIHSVSLKKGNVLMFPSNFLYPHSVKPITKGTRYSIVSWAI